MAERTSSHFGDFEPSHFDDGPTTARPDRDQGAMEQGDLVKFQGRMFRRAPSGAFIETNQPAMPMLPTEFPDVPVVREVGRGTARGGVQADQTISTLSALGGGDTFGRIADAQASLREHADERIRGIAEAETVGEFAGEVASNPLAVLEQIITSATSTTGVSVPLAAAGSAAGPLGTAVGFGSGSAMLEFNSEFLSQLEAEGIDTTDAETLRQAFQNQPGLIDRAKTTAAKKAGVIGIIDTASAGIAGRVLRPARGATRTSRGLRATGELGIQAAMGAGGEAAGQAAAGQDFALGEVGLEAIAEIGQGPIEIAANVIRDQGVDTNTLDQKEQPGRAERTEIPQPEEQAREPEQATDVIPVPEREESQTPIERRLDEIEQEVTETAEEAAQEQAEAQPVEEAEATQEESEAVQRLDEQIVVQNPEQAQQVENRLRDARRRGRRAALIGEVRALSQSLRQVLESSIGEQPLRQSGALRSLDQVVQRKTTEGARNAYDEAVRKAMDLLERSERARIEKEVRKQLKDLRKNRRTFRSKKLRSIADRIVDTFDPQAISEGKRKKLESLQGAIEEGAAIPNRVRRELDRLVKTPVRDMELDDLRGLSESIASIEHQATTFNTLKVRGKERNRLRVFQKASNEIESGPLARRPRKIDPKTGKPRPDTRNPFIRMARIPFGLLENMMPWTAARWASGSPNAVTGQILYYDIAESQKEWMGDVQQETDMLREKLEQQGFTPESMARMSDSMAQLRSRVMNLVNPGLGLSRAQRETFTTDAGSEINWTAAHRLHLLAMLEDPTTEDAILVDGVPVRMREEQEGVSHVMRREDIQRLRGQTTEQEMALVRHAVERVNTQMRQLFREWSLEHFGFDRTQTAGETYYRRVRERDSAEPSADITADMFIQNTFESVGITKQRTRGSDAILVQDFFQDFSQYSNQLYGLVRMGPKIRNAKRLLGNREGGLNRVPEVVGNAKRGRSFRKNFEDYYDTIAREVTQRGPQMDPISRALMPVIRNVGRGLLGLNPQVMLYQPMSLFAASTRMRWRDMGVSLMKGSPFRRNLDEGVSENAYLRSRGEMGGSGFVLEGDRPSARRGDDLAFAGVKFMDNLAVRTIYGAARRQAQREGYQNAQLEERAGQIAERVVKETQPTFDALHISPLALAARRNPLAKLFTFFRSQISKNLNLVIENILDIRESEGTVNQAATTARSTRNIFSVIVMQSVAVSVIPLLMDGVVRALGQLGAGEDEIKPVKDQRDAMAQVATTTVNRITGTVIGGEFLAGPINRALLPAATEAAGAPEFAASVRGQHQFAPGFSPLAGIMQDTYFAGVRASQSGVEGDPEFFKDMLSISKPVFQLSGVPATPLIREFETAVKAANEGDQGEGLTIPR